MPANRASSAVKGRVLIEQDTVHGAVLQQLASTLRERGYSIERGSASARLPAEANGPIDVLVTTARGKVDAQAMAALPHLHTIVVPTIGMEAIDIPTATAMGIAVANGATRENQVSMAEATALLVLALLYRLPGAFISGREDPTPPPAHMLSGKTVGLIGYGQVAQALVPRLLPFDCRLLVHSRRAGLQAAGVSFVSLSILLARADVVCLLAALNATTRHMLGAAELGLMKRSAYLVNTARGGLIDEEALCQALEQRKIAGAALDVFETEPLPPNSRLRSLANVLLTPHCIGHTQELWDSVLPALIQNIESACAGRLPRHCQNLRPGDYWRRLGH
jgi:D-3-phosphoglycerate dehydrogenase / 2-oxoglutarate reductase